jgi:hypothetical protein
VASRPPDRRGLDHRSAETVQPDGAGLPDEHRWTEAVATCGGNGKPLGVAIEEEIAGRDFSVSGKVRIGVAERLGSVFLAHHMTVLRAAPPQLDIEPGVAAALRDMYSHEAGIAIIESKRIAACAPRASTTYLNSTPKPGTCVLPLVFTKRPLLADSVEKARE